MKIQKKSFALILVLLFSSLSLSIFVFTITTTAKTTLPDYEPLRLDADFGSRDLPIMGEKSSVLKTAGGLHASPAPGEYYEVGDIYWWFSLDNHYGYYYGTLFELRAINILTEVWVQTNLSYGWDIFGNTFSDPRADPIVSQEHIDYLLEEFTNTIYPIDTNTFGMVDYHDGDTPYYPGEYNASSRNVILVSNIKDDAYYDPSYPYYIAGFYSSFFETRFDRNVISIDSHDWENRVGPGVARPYLYESIIAHEYQHLIHDDYNPDDPSWMNEACSLYAEPLCGYPIDYGQVRRFLFTPDNSLTIWGDQGDDNILADYGSSFLWAMYLNDHYGGPAFFSQFVQGGVPGVDGVEATLDYLGYKKNFIDVYHDWRIANLIQAEYGIYSYDTLDLNPETNLELEGTGLTVHEMPGKKIPWTFASEQFGTTWSLDGDDTEITDVGPFGSDYITFPDLNKLNFFCFNGDDLSFTPGWELIDGEWYSDKVDLMNTLIFGEAYVDSLEPTLTLTTYWDIEYDWDFGFVQISTDDGATWISLEDNEGYVKDIDEYLGQHLDVLENLPGLTGSSGIYIDLTFDLADYAGQDVLIGFRYVTDWAFLNDGWYIEDNVEVSGEKVELSRFLPFPEADFMVTLVEKRTLRNGKVKYKVRDMHIWDAYELGITLAYVSRSTEVFLIVSPIMEEGFVDYEFMTWHPRHNRK